ncbi:hypothetical protein SLEP1_g9894 [Rubroshorea leprosula]|uniref:Uncharacterized protein n=1 Tax=Rubroshorea leprosula TaxID=152421 RepID=A0AAV5I6B7_9ROSI|nr:hypothetical protein SLEP1_g9894 [Rubroshorea leprosula]
MNKQRHEIRKDNKKKIKNRDGTWRKGRHTATVQAQSVEGQSFVSRPGFIQPFPVMPRSATLATPSNGVWSEGTQCLQPHNNIFPNEFPAGRP